MLIFYLANIYNSLFRIFEKDEQHVLMLNKTPQSSQLFLPYESQKLVKQMKMHPSEPRVKGTVSVYYSKT